MPATVLDPKTALVVIDIQKGFAAFPTVHPFRDVVANNAKLAAAFRKANLPVILVTVGPSADGLDMPRTRAEAPFRLPLVPPEFADVVDEIGRGPNDILIKKRGPNAFHGTELDLQLRRRGITGIVLTGVSTSSGVDGTARAAVEHAYNVTFAMDAISDTEADKHEFVSKKVFPRLGELDTTEAILKLLPR